MTNKVWFQAGIGIILALIIIRLFIEVKDMFFPLFVVIQTIFLPLLIGGVLFYLTRPILRFLEKKGWARWTSMLAIFAALALVIWVTSSIVGPAVTKQVNSLVKDAPSITAQVEDMVDYIVDQKNRLPKSIEKSIDDQSAKVGQITSKFGSGLLAFIQSFFQGLFLLILVPFFLVYMLKDHEKFAPFIAKFFSGERKTWIRKTLHDIDHTLKAYIQGQLLVSFAVGIMLLIGYLIIGLDYALLLALFGMFMNVIPFLGPYIAVVPALIIGYIQAPEMVIWVAIIMLVAQQIESNFITPNVMGRSLDIHPLTVITIILAAGNIAGLWGIILAIPTYAVIKTILKNIYARREEIKDAATMDVKKEEELI
ncbi:AI-2E family transporter [Paenisporosarcina cavernae]|uniref:AI-2E family transporter n=1 Tax=Paenisporosarcina cavernae TaxID=2320858 RepID=A0A385YSL6_9BACL|nr:AI-2E family transporter [Paenisporosarcina cavernae]AYC28642.1 AI-2E family transporter [Paenisporosarcina cavernae]